MCKVLEAFVPTSLEKLVLRNNNISDEDFALLLIKLSQLKEGIKILATIRNNFDSASAKALRN